MSTAGSELSVHPCQHCGQTHPGTCPRIKAVEYEDGKVKRIEYHDSKPTTDQPPEDSLHLAT